MTKYEVPLIASPQKFAISLAGVPYNLTVHWCAPGGYWCLDIADVDSVNVLCGIPLVTGIDLLEQFAYLSFGGELRVETDFDLNAPPTSSNLGSQSHLYFVTP